MKINRGVIIDQIGVANDFYEAYERCFSPDSNNHIVGVPGFVCGLFASELYFKIIIGDKWKSLPKSKSHNLYNLYRKMNKQQKEKLKSIIPTRVEYNIENLLRSIGDGFTKWRYIYENGNEDFGDKHPFEYAEVFLKTYLPMLKEMADSLMLNTKQLAQK